MYYTQIKQFNNIPHNVTSLFVSSFLKMINYEGKKKRIQHFDYFYVVAHCQFLIDIIRYLNSNEAHRIDQIYDSRNRPEEFKNRHLLMKRSEAYDWFKKFWLIANVGMSYRSLFKKSTKPNNLRKIYEQQTIDEVLFGCKQTYYQDGATTITMWQTIRHLESELPKVSEQQKSLLKTLGYQTLLKGLKTTSGYQKQKVKPRNNHPPLRTHDAGMVHMDIKYICRGHTAMNKEMYALDFKNAKFKIYYGEIIECRTGEEVLRVLKNALEFFKRIGIKVFTIRTDNGSEFKISSDVIELDIVKLLNSLKTHIQYIPPKTPQANGIIERQHRCLDNEFLFRVKHINSLEELRDMYWKYIIYYNSKRYHSIIYRENHKRKVIYEIPLRMLENSKNGVNYIN